jgi:hypothetical protein
LDCFQELNPPRRNKDFMLMKITKIICSNSHPMPLRAFKLVGWTQRYYICILNSNNTLIYRTHKESRSPLPKKKKEVIQSLCEESAN